MFIGYSQGGIMKKLLIIFILLGILVISGCQSYEQRLGENILEGLFEGEEEPKKSFFISPVCKEKAKELIPEEVVMFYREGDSADWGVWEDQAWKDGIKLFDGFMHVRGGRKEGENIYYYYPDSAYGSSTTFDYSKQIITEDGIVKGTRTFSIKPLFKAIQGTERTYKSSIREYKIMDFEIIDYTLLSCKWVE